MRRTAALLLPALLGLGLTAGATAVPATAAPGLRDVMFVGKLAYLPVGDHPQRIRHGVVPDAVVASWSPVA